MDQLKRCAAVALAAATILCGCRGGTGPAEDVSKAAGAPPASPAGAMTPPELAGPAAPMQLAPLGDDDIRLYLEVMEAAADRTVHPTAEDQRVSARANRVMLNAKPGQALPPDDGRAMIRFTTMMTNMDLIVAEERHVDLKRYQGIRGMIEEVVPNPAASMIAMAQADRAGGAGGSASAADPRVKEAKDVAAKALAPYKERIQRLEAVVRKTGGPR